MDDQTREEIRQGFEKINQAKDALKVAEEEYKIQRASQGIEDSERYRAERAAIARFRQNHPARVNDILKKPVKPKKSIEELPRMDSEAPPPVFQKKQTCPHCKCDVDDTTKGFFIIPTWNGNRLRACPVCSPGVDTIRERKRVVDLRQKIFKGNNIPERMNGWDFQTYGGPRDILPQIETILIGMLKKKLGQRNGLYLGGLPGIGKTSLSIAFMREMEMHGFICLFLPIEQFFDLLHRSMDKSSKFTLDEIMWLITNVDFLIADDLGFGTNTDFALKKLGVFINMRLDALLPTVFTSNKSIDDLDAAWRSMVPGLVVGFHEGQRLTDRLHEYCFELVLRGQNQRHN